MEEESKTHITDTHTETHTHSTECKRPTLRQRFITGIKMSLKNEKQSEKLHEIL